MKKTNLIKVISILLISVMVMLFATTVNAADDNSYNDLTSTLTGNNSNSSNNSSNTANKNSSNNTANTNSNNTNNTNNSSNMTNNTNNSSVYNNTSLPKTGAADSIPVAMLVVVFGISAVYAFKKVRDYRNI